MPKQAVIAANLKKLRAPKPKTCDGDEGLDAVWTQSPAKDYLILIAEDMKEALLSIIERTEPVQRKYAEKVGKWGTMKGKIQFKSVYRWKCPGCFMGAGIVYGSRRAVRHDLRCIYVTACNAIGRKP